MYKGTLKSNISDIREKVLDKNLKLKTEEATKTALIIPLIHSLGYDTTDPYEFIPEYVADVGNKRGEKVDYAIKLDGKVEMIIECKTLDSKLTDKQMNQLLRYYPLTQAKIGILTDGNEYKFYSDFEQQNIMDTKPFAVINMRKFKTSDLKLLTNISKKTYDFDKIKQTQTNALYHKNIRKYLTDTFKTEQSIEVLKNAKNQTVLILEGTFKNWVLNDYTIEVMQPIVQAEVKKYIKNFTNKQNTLNQKDISIKQLSSKLSGKLNSNNKVLKQTDAKISNIIQTYNNQDINAVKFNYTLSDKILKQKDKLMSKNILDIAKILKLQLTNIYDLEDVCGRETVDYLSINISDKTTQWLARIIKVGTRISIQYNDTGRNTYIKSDEFSTEQLEAFKNVAMYRKIYGFKTNVPYYSVLGTEEPDANRLTESDKTHNN